MDLDDLADDEPQLDEELHDEGLEFEEDDQADPQDDPDGGLDDDDGGERAPQPRQSSRGQTRFQRLTAERDEARRERERLERDLEAERRARNQGPQRSPEELRRERETLLSGMNAEQRLEYLQRESEQRVIGRINQIEFNAFDASDRIAFDGICERNPAAARLKDEVERQLTEMRASGSNAPRKTVLAYLIGERALNAQPKARARGQRAAQEGRERQGARPVNGRGDSAPGGNRRLSERDARKARLENMKL